MQTAHSDSHILALCFPLAFVRFNSLICSLAPFPPLRCYFPFRTHLIEGRSRYCTGASILKTTPCGVRAVNIRFYFMIPPFFIRFDAF